MTIEIDLPDEPATQQLGRCLAQSLGPPLLVGLSGDLGAGKTTLVRALINALLPGTRVKSPTYTLIETYSLPKAVLHHLDLYRIEDPEELTALGLDELFSEDALVLVEWPEQGRPVLPEPDVTIQLKHYGSGRSAQLDPHSEHGRQALLTLAQLLSIERDPPLLSCRSEKAGAGSGF
jgi:tRNA threonylcarbamoyladenosine biosynthesis protein TsaE